MGSSITFLHDQNKALGSVAYRVVILFQIKFGNFVDSTFSRTNFQVLQSTAHCANQIRFFPPSPKPRSPVWPSEYSLRCDTVIIIERSSTVPFYPLNKVGSEKTASSIMRASQLLLTKKFLFNLANCHPMIIFNDANLDEVLPAAIRGRYPKFS